MVCSIRLFLSLLQIFLCLYQLYFQFLVTAEGVADFSNKGSHYKQKNKPSPGSYEYLRYSEAAPEDNAHDEDVDAVENHF